MLCVLTKFYFFLKNKKLNASEERLNKNIFYKACGGSVAAVWAQERPGYVFHSYAPLH